VTRKRKAARHPGGRPPLPEGERRVLLAVRLPPDLLGRIDAIRSAAGETWTAAVERLLRQAMATDR
jgi:hypothetical protein